ncbi:hypothetical protein Q7P35_002793 [Cladosporium inversicolor]
MAHANVSNGVLTIIASFSNGLDVLKKLRRSRKTGTQQSRKKKRDDEDALRLSRSLRNGPEDIGREYQAGSMRCDSELYAVGDATAQTSLAEILLKLNTGLVGIIASFLSRDKHSGPELDYQSLTDLSEQSRVQTIGVLRQLYQRLISRHMSANVPRAHEIKTKAKKPSNRPSTQYTRKRRPTLARVMIENSSIPSQIAMVRPSENRKPRSATQSRSSSEPPKSHCGSTPAASALELPVLPPPYFPSDPLPKQTAPNITKPPRHQNSHASLSKPRITPPRTVPEHEPLATLPYKDSSLLTSLGVPSPKLTSSASRRDLHKANLIRPNTLYSVDSTRTGRTKLGEIPMHKWVEPWDYAAAEKANMEALAGGWPVVSSKETQAPKKAAWKRWFGKRVETI